LFSQVKKVFIFILVSSDSLNRSQSDWNLLVTQQEVQLMTALPIHELHRCKPPNTLLGLDDSVTLAKITMFFLLMSHSVISDGPRLNPE
jgi:hypothetical protein